MRTGFEPGDNLQRVMNVVMPLRDRRVPFITRLVLEIVRSRETLQLGLHNSGTVHFARFNIVGGNLEMISVYDGDQATYLHDFVDLLGDVFDSIMTFVVDPPQTPVRDHPEEFVAWIKDHDLFQLPMGGFDDDALQAIAEEVARQDLRDGEHTDTFEHLRAEVEKVIGRKVGEIVSRTADAGDGQPRLCVGVFRAYAGKSASQIRRDTGLGW